MVSNIHVSVFPVLDTISDSTTSSLNITEIDTPSVLSLNISTISHTTLNISRLGVDVHGNLSITLVESVRTDHSGLFYAVLIPTLAAFLLFVCALAIITLVLR